MAHLSLGVLGPLQALIDDTPVMSFKSDKVCALLVYLAVEADRPHRRESLVGLLWPECPEQAARHSLRQCLLSLRRAIGDHTASPPYLLISREAIQLNPEADVTLDLAQFNAILRTCETSRSRGSEDASLRAARLEDMVKLYRGEFLQGFFLADSAEFEQWALVRRESLHQQVLEAHGELAGYYEEHRDFQAARRHALRQLELDPWREEAHCQMMRAQALDGQRAAALAQYETCRRVLGEELGVDPSARTRELYERIRAGNLETKDEAPPSVPTGPMHNLPVSLTSFHGREQELMELGRLIADGECRCISLVGPGGVGKTRLAVQAAGQQGGEFAHGVAFVPLAPVGSVEAAVAAIAGALRLTFYGPSEPRAQLLNSLSEKQMLLILDNVEQLLGEGSAQAGIVELVLEILQRAPGVKLLVTSREALDLQGEWVYDVRGLAFPETEQTSSSDDYPAVALFVQRGRRASPGLAFEEASLAAIARICRLVEGLPLAIELAATWLRLLSPAEIAQEIEGGLDILSASVRDLPARHRSMRVVFDQTWQRLSGREQQVLAQLSVFRGGFGRQAAEQVAGASLPVLSTLVNRSLLRRAAAGRYELHELVRQYAAGRLTADAGAYAAAQRRHYDCFLALAETAEQELKGRNQLEWLRRLEHEQDNLRAALAWALDRDRVAPGDGWALQLSGALAWFWVVRGHFHEGRSWLDQALRLGPEGRTAARAAALLGVAVLTYALGDLGATRLLAEESAAIYRQWGDSRGLAEALSFVGLTLGFWGEARLGQARLEEALQICRRTGDRWGEARALQKLGDWVHVLGDPAGRAMLEKSAAIAQELGDKYILSSAVSSLGCIDQQFGDYAAARARLEQALVIARDFELPWVTVNSHTHLGSVCQILGDYSAAQSHLEQALRVCQQHGCTASETEVLCALAENAICQGDLATARSCLQAASRLPETFGSGWFQTLVCYARGLLAHYEGDTAAAAKLLDQSSALARQGGYKLELAWSLVALGRVKRALGEVSAAAALLLQGLDLFRALGHELGIAVALEELAVLGTVQGDGVQAATLFGAAHALRERIGAPLPPVDRPAYDAAVAACRAQLGEAAFADAWALAAARPFQEVVEEALSLRRD